jgi:hypothetical protein
VSYDPVAVRAERREARVRQAVEGCPLFGWPEAPPAERVEQAALPIPDATIQGRWEAWLATEDGRLVFGVFCQSALALAARGERLSAKAIWETTRASLKRPANNDYTALAAREAEARYPALRGQFEKRRRHAA